MSKRDSFLASSINRTQGGNIARNSSHESLTAHPLLSPTIPGSSASSISSVSSQEHPVHVPPTRYVPYTPRQRASPSAVTTGTTMQSTIQASPQQHPHHGADATTKLQLMNLKAAAQKGGMDAASSGWAILEKLGTETDHGHEWNEIWHAISNGKATLLLPLEAQPLGEPITADFVKDHTILWEGSGPNRGYAPVVTLSGLRGFMADDVLTIRSSVDPSSTQFQAILDPVTRMSALNSLPPLPIPLYPQSFSSPSAPLSPPLQLPSSPRPVASTPTYPTYTMTSHNPSLPLPPRPHNLHGPKPPLPPRPRPSAAIPSHVPTPSRLTNPFASLFGRTSTPTPPASPISVAPQLHPLTSQESTDSNVHHDEAEHGISVPAFTMTKRIVRRELARSLLRAIHTEIVQGLAVGNAPSWVTESIEEFAEREGLMPFIKQKGAKVKLDDSLQAVGGFVLGTGLPKGTHMDDLGQKFQEFYRDIEHQLERKRWGQKRGFGRALGRLHHLNGSGSLTGDIGGDGEEGSEEGGEDTEKESEVEDKEKQADDQEKKVREVVEAVERTLCSVFYDRLFMQPFSDDATHDEALSSRIAAVNLLDLTLSHLGVDVGNPGQAVDKVVKACGQTLTQLDLSSRAPADKAQALVAAHKIIVDGLSKLPPIKLKSEEEIHLDEKTPRAATFGRRTLEEEADDKPSSPIAQVLVESSSSSTVVLSLEQKTSQDQPLSPIDGALQVPPSPRLTVSPPPPASPTPVSGDVILPLMIFAAVKANPPHFVSHLLYTQRFRNHTVGGEESYCLINLMAVAEFLENVDLASLGLGESEKTVVSTADLAPFSINRLGAEPTTPRSGNSGLRGRVEQQVDAIAGSANKVISGVVDSSFGVLRALIPGQANADMASHEGDEPRSTFSLLKRDTGFSIASLAASLPGAGLRPKTPVQKDEDAGQPLIEVPSRPGSVRSIRPAGGESSEGSENEEDEDEDMEEGEYDTRSIRSFESMMSSRSRKKTRKPSMGPRKSITDRLASMPGLSKLSQGHGGGDGMKASPISPPGSRPSSLLVPHSLQLPRHDTPSSSRAASPVTIRISPPNPRFLDATEDDIKVSEVSELLREYKRLVEAVRAMGGFHDD